MTARGKSGLLCGLLGCWALLLVLRWMMSSPESVSAHFNPVPQTEVKVGEDDFAVKIPMPQGRDARSNPMKNIFAMSDWQERPPRNAQSRGATAKSNLPAVPSTPEVVIPPPPMPSMPSLDELAAQAARQLQENLIKQTKDLMAQYRYLGYVYRAGRNQAFLGKGNEIYILKEGDILDGRFLVRSIKATSVMLHEGRTNVEGWVELDKDQSIRPL